MTNETRENFMYYWIAKEIWDSTKETYSNKHRMYEIFEIKGILHKLHQQESTLKDYNLLTQKWQQLDPLEGHNWHC